jgi:D-amino peptidase
VNVFVSVDIEGITGVVHADMMMPGQTEYGRGRQLMTGDANAAIEGVVQAGADYVLVADGHGPMRNLLIEDLHTAAELVTGTGDAKDYCQLEGADSESFDAAVFVGYHAMAKTHKAIHPHTIAGIAVHELRVNDRPHGETGLNATILASLGIPTIMVTGDSTTCAEARDFLGEGIETVAVKRASGRNAAICRPPSATRPEIEAAAKRALERAADIPAITVLQPLRIEIDFLNMQQCARAGRTRGIEQVGPVTIAVEGDDPWEQYRNLWAGLRSALYEPANWLA